MMDRPRFGSDPLTDVLSVVSVIGAPALHLKLGRGAALAFPGSLPLEFGSVLRGTAWLSRPGQPEPLRLVTGDCYLLVGAQPYMLGQGHVVSSSPPGNIETVMAGHRAPGGVVRWGSDDPETALICGGFELRANADLLLNRLPPMIHLASAAAGPLLPSALDALSQETCAGHLGSRLVTESLARVVLVQMLRGYAASASCDAGSWLGALTDGQISRALHLMHGDPLRRWTLRELAQAAGLSRSAFALRFRTRVGAPPLDYLLRWRMRLAGQVLRDSGRTVSSLAGEYGYPSESAFSASFKRALGCSPSVYRTRAGSTPDPLACPGSSAGTAGPSGAPHLPPSPPEIRAQARDRRT